MKILTPSEKAFLDVFLHEATIALFRGPATEELHAIGVEYGEEGGCREPSATQT